MPSNNIDQITAISFAAVVNNMRKAENQWHESAAMKLVESQGAIERIDLGENIEMTLDYQANQDGGVMASDLDTYALTKTDVFTPAVYDIAQVSYPVTWSKGDDAKNPSTTQKIAFVKGLLENAINSHDNKFEQLIFTSSSEGGVEFNGLDTLVPTSGQGTVGGINAGTDTWWRNQADTYTDASDIEAALTSVYNACLKGSGSSMGPKFLLSGATPYGLFEAGLTPLRVFNDTKLGNGGFEALAFKSAKWAFSQHGGSSVYMLNPNTYKIIVSKQYFRDKGDTQQVPGANGFYFLLYSAAQACLNNKSRVGVCYSA